MFASAATRLSVACSTCRPSTRQLINHVSITQLWSGWSLPITIAMTPLSPKQSNNRNCRPKAFSSVMIASTSSSVITAGRQVELVGLVDELGDPGEPEPIETAPAQAHAEAAQITLEIGRGLP